MGTTTLESKSDTTYNERRGFYRTVGIRASDA